MYRVELRPSTWYFMRVTAYNEAGATDSVLKFATLDYTGSMIIYIFAYFLFQSL